MRTQLADLEESVLPCAGEGNLSVIGAVITGSVLIAAGTIYIHSHTQLIP